MQNINAIAKICHQANKAYCEAIGDTTQENWEHAPEWQQDSAIKGVEFNLGNPDSDPFANHVNWLKDKELQGWTYGKEKNVERKEHPCCVPYDELPEEEQIKDKLFNAIARALLD